MMHPAVKGTKKREAEQQKMVPAFRMARNQPKAAGHMSMGGEAMFILEKTVST